MTVAQPDNPSSRVPLRLWPGVAAAGLLLLATLVAVFVTEVLPFAMMAAVAAGFAIVVWWAFLSRAPWLERLGAILLMLAGGAAARPLLHPSIAGAGMGMLFYFLAIPVLSLALVAWALASRRLASGPRRVSLVATIVLASGAFTLVRTAGTGGSSPVDLHWRWTPTPEQLLLAREPVALPAAPRSTPTPELQPHAPPSAAPPAAAPVVAAQSSAAPHVAEAGSAPAQASPPAAPEPDTLWPGFRGPGRDGVVRGLRIETDWAASPPVELWRRAIGPGWSSFAVEGDRLYTQEQRGDDELVSCYDTRTGEPVWRHLDPVRFWESNGGAGPRATPTLHDGRVYSFGATGIVNALDARDGSVVWSRNAASDTSRKVPYWGFASSPLVIGDVVVVAASGTLVGYDVASGEPRWLGPARAGSYSSPHLSTIAGVPQIILLRGEGATSVAPADGSLLWEHAWQGGAIVQPAVTTDGDVLISANDMSGGVGIRRLAVARAATAGWSVEERWTSKGLKPYFNDYVVHGGHAFGFDGNILACVDLADGKRKWKGGRYGNGQLVLLADQDLLLVLSEEGELALVGAKPDQFRELGRVKAIEGKTWNHPALAGDVLLVRNGEEMAAFRLALAGPSGNDAAAKAEGAR
jgi:outer membrane protein assembly factor BamB